MKVSDLACMKGRRVLVVGDVILDRYVKGSVERISPEAPVPVVLVRGEEHRPGGAANVAANLAALGAAPALVSMVGDDLGADLLRSELKARGLADDGLIVARGRPTTVKTRVIAHHQQVVRLDQEDDLAAPADVAAAVLENAIAALPRVQALILSDYAKGLLDERILPPLLQQARARGVPVVVDPKVRHFDLYQPATLITPNLTEAARALGREVRGEEAIREAAQAILDRLAVDAVLITLGEAGMLLAPRRGPKVHIRAQAREVFDVTGAGDTVVAVLGAGLAGGLDLEQAARWANAAAAVAVSRLGTAAVTVDELGCFAGEGAAG
jgi:D-beta-D-heptose 7-phosphate kinase/D-beta-D-heptose 1-phosphate adenosyltransferase